MSARFAHHQYCEHIDRYISHIMHVHGTSCILWPNLFDANYFDSDTFANQVMNLESLIADAEALESQFKDFLSRANLK